MKKVIFAAVCVFSSWTFAADCNSDATYGEVSKAELTKLIADKQVFLVDVNSKDSFAKQSIPGAIHFASQENFASALPQDKNALIVAYCGGVQCTAWKKAAIAACKLNYTNVKHFKGGIKGWMQKS
jgi:rhodanese-related sulfurtransferase